MAQDGRLGGGKKNTVIPLFLVLLTFTFIHFADAFIQNDLQYIEAIHFCQYVFPLVIEHTTFCAAKAMLYHWAP